MKKTLLTVSTVAVISFGGLFVGSEAVNAEKIDEVKKELKEVNNKLSNTEAKLAETLNKMRKANEEIARIDTALDANQKEIDKTEATLKELDKEINQIDVRIEERNNILKDRLASYQANGGNIQFREVLFGAKDPIEFISRVEAVTTITNSDTEIIEQQEADKLLRVVKVEEVEKEKVELDGIKETMQAQKEEKKIVVDTLKKEEKEYKAQKAKLNDEKSSKNSELAALEAQVLAEMSAPAEQVVASANSNNNTVQTNNSVNNASNSGNGNKTAKKQSTAQVAYTGAGGSAIAAGKQFIGRSSYVFGAKNPGAGQFDCSGFVSWAYEQEGLSLPRNTDGMARTGSSISLGQAKPGDLVFFDTYKKNGHVGIYLGGGQFIGSQSGKGVEIASMNNSYWKSTFSGHVRRVK